MTGRTDALHRKKREGHKLTNYPSMVKLRTARYLWPQVDVHCPETGGQIPRTNRRMTKWMPDQVGHDGKDFSTPLEMTESGMTEKISRLQSKRLRLLHEMTVRAWRRNATRGTSYSAMTPEPRRISPEYQTANWPGVMPRWGLSKRIYRPPGRKRSVAPCSGCRYRIRTRQRMGDSRCPIESGMRVVSPEDMEEGVVSKPVATLGHVRGWGEPTPSVRLGPGAQRRAVLKQLPSAMSGGISQ